MVGADAANGPAVRNHDNERIYCRIGYVKGLGMWDQHIRGSFPEDLKGLQQADYCGVDRERRL
jgi:hypothetical protein